MNVWLEEYTYGYMYVYRVMVDGQLHKEIRSTEYLTWSQQSDIAAGFKDALTRMPWVC